MPGQPLRRQRQQLARFAKLREPEPEQAPPATALSMSAQAQDDRNQAMQALKTPTLKGYHSLKTLLLNTTDVVELVNQLMAARRLVITGETAAEKRIGLDAVALTIAHIIGSPRQSIDMTTDDSRTIRLVWGHDDQVIEGEATVLDDTHAPAREALRQVQQARQAQGRAPDAT